MKICVLSHPEAGIARPRAFHLGGRRLAIAGIVEHWQTPGYLHFHVRDLDGRRFVLRHCSRSGDWELEGVSGPPDKPRRTAAPVA